MDDSSLMAAPAPGQILGQAPGTGLHADGWRAELQLNFRNTQGRSFLASRQHTGPLVIQKTLHPEGEDVCHGVIVHPPGGVAGGDQLSLNVQAQDAAHALLTTPGAGKWYKANGREASQTLQFKLQASVCLEWLPQENIVFDGARLRLAAEVELADKAVYAGWEILCLGRQASQERWLSGSLHQRLVIRRNGVMIWNERALLTPASLAMTSRAGLNGRVVSGSFVVAAGSLPADLLLQCRQLSAEPQSLVAISALPDIVVARYMGQSSQAARRYFQALWQILRPWYAGRPACIPRIWST